MMFSQKSLDILFFPLTLGSLLFSLLPVSLRRHPSPWVDSSTFLSVFIRIILPWDLSEDFLDTFVRAAFAQIGRFHIISLPLPAPGASHSVSSHIQSRKCFCLFSDLKLTNSYSIILNTDYLLFLFLCPSVSTAALVANDLGDIVSSFLSFSNNVLINPLDIFFYSSFGLQLLTGIPAT